MTDPKHVLVLVNTLNSVNSFVYSNHIGFWTATKKRYPNTRFEFFTPPRMSIDMARNTAAKMALEYDCDYLMFIDDDVLIPENTLESLINCDSDIAAGLVIIRGYPFHVMAFRSDSEKGLPYFDELPTLSYDETGQVYTEDEASKLSTLEQKLLSKSVLKDPVTQDDGLAAVGFSCCLIKVSLLKRIPPPFFITGPRNTEDIYFCLKAKDVLDTLRQNDPTIPELTIAMSTSTQCGHFLHPEPIEWRVIDIFKEMYEALDSNLKERTEKSQDIRDMKYIEKNMKAF